MKSAKVAPAPTTEVVVKNCTVFKDRNLAERDGSYVFLAETNDLEPKELIAKCGDGGGSSVDLEFRILDHVRKSQGQKYKKYVVALHNWDAASHTLLLERGDIGPGGDLGKLFELKALNELSHVDRIGLAKQLVEIGKFLSECGVVWGDMKPGNFVRFRGFAKDTWKAIDFDSSRRDAGVGAVLNGPQEIPDQFIPGEAMITPGFVAPERAAAILATQSITADSKQDVFVMGLIVYQIFANKPFFGPEKKQEDNAYLRELADPSFQADLSAITDSSVRKILAEMLARDPGARYSFKQVLQHKTWMGHSSISTSSLATRADVRRVDPHSKVEVLPASRSVGQHVRYLVQHTKETPAPWLCTQIWTRASKEASSTQAP